MVHFCKGQYPARQCCSARQKYFAQFTVCVSRLLPKSVPLLVRAAFGSRRHRSSSHRRSTFHFPFVLSCLPPHLVSIPSLHVVYLTLCSPHVLVPELLVHVMLVCNGFCLLMNLLFCLQWFYLLNCAVVNLFLLSCARLLCRHYAPPTERLVQVREIHIL